MDWTLIWLLNGIGILVFFLTRYNNRKKQYTGFSLSYWFKDNIYELSVTILLNLAAMIILFLLNKNNGLENLVLKLPEWIQPAGVPGLSLGLGLGFTWTIYTMFLKKAKDAKDEKCV